MGFNRWNFVGEASEAFDRHVLDGGPSSGIEQEAERRAGVVGVIESVAAEFKKSPPGTIDGDKKAVVPFLR